MYMYMYMYTDSRGQALSSLSAVPQKGRGCHMP